MEMLDGGLGTVGKKLGAAPEVTKTIGGIQK
jgi:hypothetical protein